MNDERPGSGSSDRPIVRVFGGTGVETADGSVPIGGPRQRRLLALLAVRAGSVVDLDWLSEYLWGHDGRPTRPERAIRTYVSRIRTALPVSCETWIETTATGYRLAAPPESVEHLRFSMLRTDARRARERDDPASAHRLLGEALASWRGDPFVELQDLDWALATTERLRLDRLEMLEERWETALALGKHTQITGELGTFVAEHGERERAVRQLALALHRSGRSPEALRVIAAHRHTVVEATGLDPSPDVVELERAILDRDPTLEVDRIGVPLRGYRLLEEAGVGAFSVVWRGVQPSVGREVAIKQIRSELASRPEFIRRFEAEAHVVARVEHPHIVPLIDFWRDPDSAYLVMRWLSGGTLERRLDDGPLTLDGTVALARQVGSALATAHGHGVVHRDVKPANILFDDAGHAFLADFGIAVFASESAGPEAALSPGSPVYAAPEQLCHEPVGPEADVYSLGVVLQECLTGPLEPSPTGVDADVPPAVDAVLRRATAHTPGERFATIAELVAALDDAAAPSLPASRSVIGPVRSADGVTPPDNPYVGLRAFDQTDTERFFGRERLIDQLVARLSGTGLTARCVVVIGPSGSGKSSVVRAGLVPALRRGAAPGSERWFTTTMVPGPDPFESLEAALLRVAASAPSSLLDRLRSGPRGILRGARRCVASDDARILLVIDQFEELFAGVRGGADDVAAFLDALAVAIEDPTSPLRVVITMRADYLHRPLEHAAFAPVVRDAAVTVVPLAPDELQRAITEPARLAGAGFEPGLVARLVAESAGQPSPLPMLQHTLAELFERREDRAAPLTIRAYEEVGGLSGALAAKADALHAAGDPARREAIRRVFGRLTNPDQGGGDLRRRVAVADLGDDADTAWVVEQFAAARLLTFDRDPATREPTVEVAHEALLREWPLLAGWLAEDAGLLRDLDAIAVAANSWVAGGRSESDLHRGARLVAAVDVANAAPDRLRDVDREFIDASAAAARARRSVEQRRVRRLRRLVAATAAALVVALVAGAVALRQRERADDEARAAEQDAAAAVESSREARVQTDRARTAAMVSTSRALLDEDPELALLVGLEANARQPGETTERAVLDALGRRGLPSAGVDLFARPDGDECAGGPEFVSADGRTLFLTTEQAMISQDLLTGAVTDHGRPPEPCVPWISDPESGLRWAGTLTGGHWIGTLEGDLRPIDGRDRGGPLTREFAGDRLLFGADGANGPTAVIVDMTSGARVGSPPTDLVLVDPQSAAVGPGGDVFAVGGVSPDAPGDPAGDGRLFVLDAEAGDVVARVALPTEVVRVAFDPTGGEIVTLSRRGDVVTVDASTGEIVAQTSTAVSGFDRLAVRPDGLVVITSVGQAELVDRVAGRVRPPLPLPGVSVIRDDGTVVNNVDRRVRFIDLDVPPLVTSSWSVDPSALVGFGAGRAGVVLPDGTAEIVELATGEREPVRLVDSDGTVFPAISILPEADALLAFADDGRITRWSDGRLVDEVRLSPDRPSLSVSRGIQPDLDDGPPGAAYAGLGAMLGYNPETGRTVEHYRVDLTSDQLAVPLRLTNRPGLDVSAVPAADGAIHVMSATGRLSTYDATGDRVAVVETQLRDPFAVGRDEGTGRLAFGGSDGAVLIDPATGAMTTLDGVGPVATIGFVRDGELVVVVGASGTVRLWDPGSDRQIGVVWEGTGGASPSPPYHDPTTGSIWVATSGRLIEIPPPSDWVDRACALATRRLTPDERAVYVPGDEPPTQICGDE